MIRQYSVNTINVGWMPALSLHRVQLVEFKYDYHGEENPWVEYRLELRIIRHGESTYNEEDLVYAIIPDFAYEDAEERLNCIRSLYVGLVQQYLGNISGVHEDIEKFNWYNEEGFLDERTTNGTK